MTGGRAGFSSGQTTTQEPAFSAAHAPTTKDDDDDAMDHRAATCWEEEGRGGCLATTLPLCGQPPPR
uniref:Uncharacterized protein n=1 Tax=Aegilops tauschii subsp. strangulata TaxID=200361 RepID=A0A453BQS0_AEGTS